jgi:hypothetical protein
MAAQKLEHESMEFKLCFQEHCKAYYASSQHKRNKLRVGPVGFSHREFATCIEVSILEV